MSTASASPDHLMLSATTAQAFDRADREQAPMNIYRREDTWYVRRADHDAPPHSLLVTTIYPIEVGS